MQIEIVRQDPSFKVEMSLAEFEFLYRLLGNHIVGGGTFRTISDNIYEALESCSHMYALGVPKGTLPTTSSAQASIRLA